MAGPEPAPGVRVRLAGLRLPGLSRVDADRVQAALEAELGALFAATPARARAGAPVAVAGFHLERAAHEDPVALGRRIARQVHERAMSPAPRPPAPRAPRSSP